MSKNKPFVFNDETKKNSYGFYISTSGIDTTDFVRNPICLADHSNKTKDVLGTWSDLAVKVALLTGTPVFDTQNPEGLEVVRKVQSGTLKGCSMGIRFSPKDLKMQDGKLMLTKCVLTEVSIVAVPSNSSAIVLYDTDGVLLSDEAVQQFCLSAQEPQKTFKTQNMKLLLTHLQLADGSTESAVLAAVKEIETKLSAITTERDNFKVKFEDLQAKHTAKLQATFDAELSLAKTDGRLDDKGETALLELAEDKLENALNFLKALPKRKAIKDNLENAQATLAAYDKMSWDELDKSERLAEIKLNHNEYYVERFKQQFGKEPKNN